MKLFKKLRKGFTLIELVVVIAVIAILSAVSVVSYISITNRAKQSNDQQRVDQMNIAMKAAEISKKPSTMHEALEALKEEGFVAENLKAEANKSEFAYSMSKNKFVILENASKVTYPKDMTGATKSADLWRFTKVGTNLDDGYSYYLLNDVTGDVQPAAGLDVGENDDISLINFASSKNETVVIRTNGGKLVINAPEGIVNHYGDGEVLDITAIAGDSYHEYGRFPKASIAKGRLVVEQSGEIPSVEITAVPTQEAPIKVETSKDIVVSASEEVVAQVGSGSLDNVSVKVTSASATVVVDEKIDKSNVDATGKSESDIVSITKVANYSELLSALSNKKPYIMFTSDISYATLGAGLFNVNYNATIDGNGFNLNGYGARGSQKTSISFNAAAGDSQMIDVSLKNLTINNGGAAGRPLESRGKLRSLTLENVHVNATGSGGENNQAITFGGNQATPVKFTMINSSINATSSGYPIIAFNPFDAVISDSYFDGYCGIYFKGVLSSAGCDGSTVVATNTTFNSPNSYDIEGANSFGVFAFEKNVSNCTVTLNDCKVNVEQSGTAYQALVSFHSSYNQYKGNLITLNGAETFVNGYLSMNGQLTQTSKIVLNGGTYSANPITQAAAVGIPIAELGSGKSVSSTSEFMYVVQ